jgi:hypothetical protein
MMHHVAAGVLHHVAPPAAKLGGGILLLQSLHEAGGVEVTGPFAGNEVVFHSQLRMKN